MRFTPENEKNRAFGEGGMKTTWSFGWKTSFPPPKRHYSATKDEPEGYSLDAGQEELSLGNALGRGEKRERECLLTRGRHPNGKGGAFLDVGKRRRKRRGREGKPRCVEKKFFFQWVSEAPLRNGGRKKRTSLSGHLPNLYNNREGTFNCRRGGGEKGEKGGMAM